MKRSWVTSVAGMIALAVVAHVARKATDWVIDQVIALKEIRKARRSEE